MPEYPVGERLEIRGAIEVRDSSGRFSARRDLGGVVARMTRSMCVSCRRGEHSRCETMGPFADPSDGDLICSCNCAYARGEARPSWEDDEDLLVLDNLRTAIEHETGRLIGRIADIFNVPATELYECGGVDCAVCAETTVYGETCDDSVRDNHRLDAVGVLDADIEAFGEPSDGVVPVTAFGPTTSVRQIQAALLEGTHEAIRIDSSMGEARIREILAEWFTGAPGSVWLVRETPLPPEHGPELVNDGEVTDGMRHAPAPEGHDHQLPIGELLARINAELGGE